MSANIAASIHARLLTRAKMRGAEQLGHAIKATFQRRGTPLPEKTPEGLSDEFAANHSKHLQWQGFIAKNRLEKLALEKVIEDLRQFTFAPLAHARQQDVKP